MLFFLFTYLPTQPSELFPTTETLPWRPISVQVVVPQHMLFCPTDVLSWCSTNWGRDSLGLQCVLETDPTSQSSPVSWEAGPADMSQGNMSPLEEEISGQERKTKKMRRRISSFQCSSAVLFYWTVKEGQVGFGWVQGAMFKSALQGTISWLFVYFEIPYR